MKRKITSLILTLLLTIQCSTVVMAHPEPIKKKTIDLKTDTIIVQEKGSESAIASTNK